MHQRLTTAALGILLCALPTSCVSMQAYEDALASNRALQEEREDLARAYAELEAERDRLRGLYDEAAAGAKDAAWLAQRRAEVERLLADLEQKTIDIEGVGVREAAEGTIFDVEGEVLFSSGQAVVTESGLQTLKKLAPIVAEGGLDLRVQGHTDSDPIVRSQWKSNLHLSAARALAVADVLIANGLPAELVSVAGYGPYAPRPNNPGKTEEERKRWNRRVEILLLRAN